MISIVWLLSTSIAFELLLLDHEVRVLRISYPLPLSADAPAPRSIVDVVAEAVTGLLVDLPERHALA